MIQTNNADVVHIAKYHLFKDNGKTYYTFSCDLSEVKRCLGDADIRVLSRFNSFAITGLGVYCNNGYQDLDDVLRYWIKKRPVDDVLKKIGLLLFGEEARRINEQ